MSGIGSSCHLLFTACELIHSDCAMMLPLPSAATNEVAADTEFIGSITALLFQLALGACHGRVAIQ